MKNIFKCSLALGTIALLTGLSSEHSTVREGGRQKTDFFGTLTTQSSTKQEKQPYSVGNIAIGNMITGIRFFEVPSQPVGSVLSENPHEGTVFEINLEKGFTIEVPNPGKLWNYKRNERSAKVEYVAVVITPCDKGEKKEYVVETTRHLSCEELGACDPTSMKMKIPLSQVKKLTIEGIRTEEESRRCPIKRKTENSELEESNSLKQ